MLAATPAATGVLFDLPHVIEAATRSATDRLVLESGNFFTDPLPSCDCYLVMHVLHDWSDGDAAKILAAIHRAAPREAAVLVLESIIPDDPAPSWERILDMHMLAIHAGRERTGEDMRTCSKRQDLRWWGRSTRAPACGSWKPEPFPKGE